MLQGKDFPVYRMDIDGELCEVALARKERKVSEGHNGFVIYASPDITIEDDLARRDITINSMAIDLETNKLIDPFYGELDLRTETIRATTEAFVKIRFVCIVLQDLLQNMVSLLNTKHRR